MSESDFKKKLFQAGFLNKKDFAERLGLNQNTISQWGRSNPFPTWLDYFFECAIKAKKYDDLQDFFKNKSD